MHGSYRAVMLIARPPWQDVITDVVDCQNGEYRLKWRSKYSGTFKTHVCIDGVDCVGSPIKV